VAGLGLNLAVSLLVWHALPVASREAWWVTLVQANVIAAAGVALIWLALSRKLYGVERPGPTTAPLLGVQLTVGLLGNVALLIGPLGQLLAEPEIPHASVQLAGEGWGWLSLLVALVAAGWYAGRTLARGGIHMLCGLGLALGVLTACAASAWDQEIP